MATVVVGGALANKLLNGGEAWVRLSWILGLRRLGLDVWFVEQIDAGTCVDASGEQASFADCENRRYFETVVREFGLEDRATLVYEGGRATSGVSLEVLADVASEAELLINISGHLRLPRLTRRLRRKAYVDLDPGFTQFWHADGTAPISPHDAYFTVGENIGRPGCDIPTGGLDWRPVAPPVVLEEWPVAADGGLDRFTTVGAWRGPFGVVERDGRTYGLKVHEFRKVIELPRAAALPFEIALDIHPADHRDREALEENGWRLVDPRTAVPGPLAFRAYVQGSGAEFSVAQGIYVGTSSGWFSDRSVRYLASGRPALLQDTGFSGNYRVGEGLVAYRDLDGAVAGARRIAADYEAHREAARALAEERFDSDKVLARFLEQAGAQP
jgi:hypothetical protein